MVTISNKTFDVETLAARIEVSDDVLANVDVYTHRNEMFRSTVLELKARVLAGAPRTVTANAYVETTTVDSVWDAVCVYWLATLFYLVYDFTFWDWAYRAFMWADGHERVIVKRDTDTQTINQNVCPHIKIQRERDHVQFLTTELETE